VVQKLRTMSSEYKKYRRQERGRGRGKANETEKEELSHWGRGELKEEFLKKLGRLGSWMQNIGIGVYPVIYPDLWYTRENGEVASKQRAQGGRVVSWRPKSHSAYFVKGLLSLRSIVTGHGMKEKEKGVSEGFRGRVSYERERKGERY